MRAACCFRYGEMREGCNQVAGGLQVAQMGTDAVGETCGRVQEGSRGLYTFAIYVLS